MLKAGILAEGELMITDEGVPQGSVCSPILANIYAHYVLDIWFQSVVKRHCRGQVELFRYADDAVICCRRHEDAERNKMALPKRLEKFHLRLNEEKTKLVSFSKGKMRSGIRQGVFDFLGFTFYLGRSRQSKVIPKVKTSGKRLRSKLTKVNHWARQVRNQAPLSMIWKVFRQAYGSYQLLRYDLQFQAHGEILVSGNEDFIQMAQQAQSKKVV